MQRARVWKWLPEFVVYFICQRFIPVILGTGLILYACSRENIVTDAHANGQPQCRSMISGFIAGLKTYQTEYNQFPAVALDSKDPHTIHRTRGAILMTLHPDQAKEPDKTNLRKIDFYDPPPAKPNKTGGLYFDPQNRPVLVDPWGEPYYFIIDIKDEGKVPNPDPRDNKEHPFIDSSIIMFSAGPDHDPNTWDDNVMSWK